MTSRADIKKIRDLFAQGKYESAYADAASLASDHPDWPEVQFLAGELAYRLSRWSEAVGYFEAGGDPGNAQPALLFYEAVSLYETGRSAEAAATLRRALPGIEHTPFVKLYAKKILGITLR